MAEIKRVGVLGCGLMGSGIAQISAAAGYETIVREVSDEVVQKGIGGIGRQLGKQVEKGKLADLVVLDADPLSDIHNTAKIRWVIKNGELYEAATMKRLWPTVVEPPKQYWQSE